MGPDIRIPLGSIFATLGSLLIIYGAITHGASMYALSNEININIVWGAAMAAFGAIMLFSAGKVRRRGSLLQFRKPTKRS